MTIQYSRNDHRWKPAEIKKLMILWEADKPLRDISTKFNTSPNAVRKMVQKLRSNGVPLKRHTKGHVEGRTNKNWTQGEMEYVLRRKGENATNEEIGSEIGRSENSVYCMTAKMRKNKIPVKKLAHGNHSRYDFESLSVVAMQLTNANKITEPAH